ncbi:MAG: cation transporter [Clostridia bacterium]|nr:cation transporter [Clostridia bacterium]
MKKSFKVKGIDCANCAAKLEAGISKLPGVDKATVSFMTERLTLEAADDKFAEVLEAAKALTKKLEPDWEIVSK